MNVDAGWLSIGGPWTPGGHPLLSPFAWAIKSCLGSDWSVCVIALTIIVVWVALFSVLGTGTMYLAPEPLYMVTGTWYLVPGTRHGSCNIVLERACFRCTSVWACFMAFPHSCIMALYYCVVCNVLYSRCCIRIVLG